jgi:hypothetical protein
MHMMKKHKFHERRLENSSGITKMLNQQTDKRTNNSIFIHTSCDGFIAFILTI